MPDFWQRENIDDASVRNGRIDVLCAFFLSPVQIPPAAPRAPHTQFC